MFRRGISDESHVMCSVMVVSVVMKGRCSGAGGTYRNQSCASEQSTIHLRMRIHHSPKVK
jgi:hypothetical protein